MSLLAGAEIDEQIARSGVPLSHAFPVEARAPGIQLLTEGQHRVPGDEAGQPPPRHLTPRRLEAVAGEDIQMLHALPHAVRFLHSGSAAARCPWSTTLWIGCSSRASRRNRDTSVTGSNPATVI